MTQDSRRQLGDSSPVADPVIVMRDVRKSYPAGNTTLNVFHGFDYAIAKGSFLSIIGPSGCGKSTLLKMIAGLEPVSGGKILFRGEPVTAPPKGMIYVFQQYTRSILPWRTVLQNIEFGLESRGRVQARAARERCMEYVKLVGLEGYEHYFPYQLSGGMQQRVVIARALICEPEVLLMDEPFSAVDAMTRAILQELILKIWEKLSITILFVTHDVDEGVFLSGRIISLSRAPAMLREDCAIDLPYPRDQLVTRALPDFHVYRQQLFSSIFQQEKEGLAQA